jgi:predicted nucleotidyltransferase
MKNNKNIDRLFQEKFKDFETEPNKQTWTKIQLGLKEKKQRKIIPFWLKYTGIAAAFLFGIFALNTFYNTNTTSDKKIVIESKSLNDLDRRKDSATINSKIINKRIDLKNSPQITIKNLQKTEDDGKQSATTEKAKNVYNQTQNQKTAAFYNRKNYQSLEKIELVTSTKNSGRDTSTIFIFPNAKESKDFLVEKNLSNISTEKGDLATAKKQLINDSLLDEVPNELDVILKQNETKNETTVAVIKNKWLITPNVAAMFTSANGANIDQQFAENSKTMDNNIGFGIGVNYAVNKKIAFRSGINKFALGYNINNVSYSSALNATPLTNVRYNTAAMVEISSKANTASLAAFEKNLQRTSEGTIKQNISYYEVPMEVSYLLLDKKIGINVIGGFSTLLLDNNKISLLSSEINLPLGQASNLNAVHFTTNIGLGFKYKFVKSFQLNFEPMVKYQLNTFSNNSSNTRPLLIGLYSGISYSF